MLAWWAIIDAESRPRPLELGTRLLVRSLLAFFDGCDNLADLLDLVLEGLQEANDLFLQSW